MGGALRTRPTRIAARPAPSDAQDAGRPPPLPCARTANSKAAKNFTKQKPTQLAQRREKAQVLKRVKGRAERDATFKGREPDEAPVLERHAAVGKKLRPKYAARPRTSAHDASADRIARDVALSEALTCARHCADLSLQGCRREPGRPRR
jgi:hypothetical protein